MVKLNISINKNKLLGPVQTALFQAKKNPGENSPGSIANYLKLLFLN